MVVPRPRSLRNRPSLRRTRNASRIVCLLTSYCSVRAISPGKPSSNAPSETRRRMSALTCAHSGSGSERSGRWGPDPFLGETAALVAMVCNCTNVRTFVHLEYESRAELWRSSHG